MNFLSFHRNIQLRLTLHFFTTLATSAVIPFLAIFFSNQVGEVATGLMYIGVILSGITGALAGGRRTDRVGRKKTILLSEGMISGGYFVAGVSNLIFPLSPYANFGIFIVILFFTGMVAPAYGAIIIDASSKENRKAVYTFSYWLTNLAMAAGGLIGALLFKKYPYELFIGISVVVFFSWVATKYVLEDTFLITDKTLLNAPSTTSGFQDYKGILMNKRFVLFTVAGLFLLSLEESLTTYMGIKLVEEITTPVPLLEFNSFVEVNGFQLIGLLRAESTIIVVVLSLVVAGVLKKFQDRWLLISGGFCYGFGYIVISYSSIPLVLIIAMFIATVGELAHIPAKQAYVASLVPDDARGTYMAVYGLSFQLSGMIAALFVMASAVLSPEVITSIFIIMALSSIVIYFVLFMKEQERQMNLKTIA
ncbi:MFS transporter [Rossellomorea aquimaris]|uniref:MFS transporter n=1 Tax=Rossellomorea aquimaris TaxID=189382 RepID=UPI0007D06BEC|nr:MFS transporter [Rossellomorea aquimaris]